MSKSKPPGKPPNNDCHDDRPGYKRPPKAHQFKKGCSGNPRGRPKRSDDIAHGILSEYVGESTVRINGKSVKMTHIEAVLLTLRVAALRGDRGAARDYLKWGKDFGLVDYLDRYLKGATVNKLIIEYVDGPEPAPPPVIT